MDGPWLNLAQLSGVTPGRWGYQLILFAGSDEATMNQTKGFVFKKGF